MNKHRLLFTLLLAVGVSGALYFTGLLQSPILRMTYALKSFYLEGIGTFQNALDEHFSQQQTIIDLREKNRYYEKELLSLHQVADEYHKLLQEQNSTFTTQAGTELVRAISYVRFGDPHKLWIEMEHFNPTHVYGLLYRGYTAGIVVSNNNRPMALLNGDVKSSYAVNVGTSMAPGIVRGTDSKMLVVEFIPTWIPIAVGDEVATSGLDQIFIAGLKVGKVVSISKSQGYQSATVEPYFYGKIPGYFHVITKVR